MFIALASVWGFHMLLVCLFLYGLQKIVSQYPNTVNIQDDRNGCEKK